MAIQSNLSTSPVDLAGSVADTTLLASVASPSRQAVTGFSLYNTAAAARVVSIYESPNTTSASGKLVATYTIAAGTSQDVVECIGQGYSAGQNIVGVMASGSAGDVNSKITTTLYTAGS